MSDAPRRKKFRGLKLLFLVIGVLAVAVAIREGIFAFNHVFEANARVQANFTVLSSSVNSRIEKIHVQRGDQVTAGTQLATMESDVAQLDRETLQADAERERALRAQIEAELAYFRADLGAKIETTTASISLLRAEYRTLLERHAIAKTNVDRVRALLNRSVVSKQRIDEANDTLLELTGKLHDLQTQIQTNEKLLNERRQRKKQEQVYLSRIAVTDRNLEKIAVLSEQTERKLRNMHIYAPVDGVINEIYVNPGAYLEDGDRVFLLHQPDEVWVEANIVESEIRHVKPGQSVIVEIDAYPFEQFSGTVRALGAVTSENIINAANGPIDSRSVQRIPVIIDLEAPDKPLWPGMRAAVNIVVR